MTTLVKPKGTKWLLISVLVAATVTAAALYVGRAGSVPPANSQVSALTRLPAPATIPGQVQSFLTTFGAETGTSATDASSDVRLLRKGLGASKSDDVYAFPSASGAVCFILLGVSATCGHQGDTQTPGLSWMIGGGDATTPSRFVAVAVDDITAVTLEVDGSSVPVSLVNNVAYAEFPSDAKAATIHVERADGSSSSAQLSLDG